MNTHKPESPKSNNQTYFLVILAIVLSPLVYNVFADPALSAYLLKPFRELNSLTKILGNAILAVGAGYMLYTVFAGGLRWIIPAVMLIAGLGYGFQLYQVHA